MGGILALMVLSFVITSLLSRGKAGQVPPGTPRNYGVAGGAICPRCGRPFARHLFAPKMLLGKLERCPYCGKWSIVRAASRQQLAAAEAAELQQAASGQPMSAQFDQDQLRHDLEDSRFQDQ